MVLEEDVLAIGLDADHTLSVKRAPCSIACFCLAEIPAADDGSLRSRRAGSFDFLPVAGVKLDAAGGAIQFVKHYADNAAASVGDELLNESGFVHGFEIGKGFSARARSISGMPMTKGPLGPAVTFLNNQALLPSIRDAFALSLDRFCHSRPFVGHKTFAASL